MALKLGCFEADKDAMAVTVAVGDWLLEAGVSTSTLARGSHVRAERLMLRSGPPLPGVGEYGRPDPKMSTSCSCRTTEYLGSRRNFGTESCISQFGRIRIVVGDLHLTST